MGTGRTLQNSLFFFLTIGFGLRGSHESRQLKWGDVKLKVDSNGKEFLEFNERLTKTRKGNSEGGSRAFAPKVFAMGGDKCPFFFCKIYRAHRPQAMNHDEAPFYLTPKRDPLCSKNVQGIWYGEQHHQNSPHHGQKFGDNGQNNQPFPPKDPVPNSLLGPRRSHSSYSAVRAQER